MVVIVIIIYKLSSYVNRHYGRLAENKENKVVVVVVVVVVIIFIVECKLSTKCKNCKKCTFKTHRCTPAVLVFR